MSEPTPDAAAIDRARRNAADLVSALVFVDVGLATLYGAWTMPRLEIRGIHPLTAPGLLPGVLAAALILCGVLLAAKACARTRRARWAGGPGGAGKQPRGGPDRRGAGTGAGLDPRAGRLAALLAGQRDLRLQLHRHFRGRARLGTAGAAANPRLGGRGRAGVERRRGDRLRSSLPRSAAVAERGRVRRTVLSRPGPAQHPDAAVDPQRRLGDAAGDSHRHPAGAAATMGVALLVTFTYPMAPEQAILTLMCVYIGAMYGGNTVRSPHSPLGPQPAPPAPHIANRSRRDPSGWSRRRASSRPTTRDSGFACPCRSRPRSRGSSEAP